MKLRYTYHSEHHADAQDRWMHFLLFAGAFLLVFAAGQQLFLFFTDWHATDHEHGWWHLFFGLLYLLVGLGLAYWGYRLDHDHRNDAVRFVRVDDEYLTWHLHQQDEEEQVALSRIASLVRPNIRELVLTLRNGGTITLPIYLITNEEKQEELIRILEKRPDPVT